MITIFVLLVVFSGFGGIFFIYFGSELEPELCAHVVVVYKVQLAG